MKKYDDIAFDDVIDTSGLQCPWPLIKVKQKIKTMASKETLKIIYTDASSAIDLKVFSEKYGHKIISCFHEINYEVVFMIKALE